ncbi:transcriptional regulator, HxlR family [Kribbella flavida DSM 17836]|uniref:Transcriptional regulator, HxlR family n=1 Tax=Kribbella flavida (strain DSM 17836 / JCM 10339 / NBRC 14399) TaxID=479435 RepID=D2PLI9_KRIFD|nr:transcriptional regulator, HxlR family [Kribbella flavida DSM 17836]
MPRPRPGSRRPARARLPDGHLANVYSAACPSRQALDRLADKWSVLLIGALEAGPRHFGQLRQQVDGISEKMLTQTLRSLETDGLVIRRPNADRTVSYELTPLGHTVREPMAAVRAWAERYIDDIEQAREQAGRQESGDR